MYLGVVGGEGFSDGRALFGAILCIPGKIWSAALRNAMI